ncbi:integrase catalytic domain-containing protein [Trichonephila clavipes]|nr:integrase catalytic domain-containing protein [Trichonephila clavipes]
MTLSSRRGKTLPDDFCYTYSEYSLVKNRMRSITDQCLNDLRFWLKGKKAAVRFRVSTYREPKTTLMMVTFAPVLSIVASDSDLEPLESEILDLEDDCEDIQCRHFERNVDSQRSPGSETLPNMEPRITPTLNVNSECFQPKQTIPSCVESFENGEEFVGHSKGHSTMLLSTALVKSVFFFSSHWSMRISHKQTLDHLDDNIRRVIADIRPQMLEKVIENWTSDWTTYEPAVLAIDDGDTYPLAAEVIMSDVYMDDLFTGADDLESGRKHQVQLVSMLKGAGMELLNRQLVIHYYYQTQYVKLRTSLILLQPRPRPLDSCGSRIWILLLSRFLPWPQTSLWQLKLGWNDPLPSNLVSYWKSFIDALESINCLDIPRYCLQDKSIRTELHGFSDSSERAYDAALYLRCINTSGQISVRLLCSKSKVAPLKSITIPRLELCGAVLLSKLLKRTLDAFKVNISQIYFWTDSSIVLAWIKRPLAQLKTFVRNRVYIIQELPESDFWKHVNSENNPADILSRGIGPNKVQHCELWWFGPPFLYQYKELEHYDISALEGDDLFLHKN